VAAQGGYVTSQTLGTLRNNYSGYVGMQVVVSSNPIILTALGRMMASGNNGTHTVKLVKVSDGTDVPGGSVSIAMGGSTVGQFQYASLSNPMLLPAGTAYYVMSQESAGGDAWYDNDTKVTTSSVATESSSAWGYGLGQWYPAGSAGQAYVTVDFKYATNVPAAQGGYVTSQTLGTLRNNYSGYVGMQIVVGSTGINMTALGRMMAAGNSGTHTVKLVKVSDGTDVPGGSVSIAMGGGTVGEFQYANLSSPVLLPAGATYYVMSQESAGEDAWYDDDTKVTTAAVATEISAAWGYGLDQWHPTGFPGQAYVPVDFKYSSPAPAVVSLELNWIPGIAPSTGATVAVMRDPAGTSQIVFRLIGEPGKRYVVESSSDMVQWSQLGSTIIENGIIGLQDTNRASPNQRFYRLSPVAVQHE
jgi:hypothetical protein